MTLKLPGEPASRVRNISGSLRRVKVAFAFVVDELDGHDMIAKEAKMSVRAGHSYQSERGRRDGRRRGAGPSAPKLQETLVRTYVLPSRPEKVRRSSGP